MHGKTVRWVGEWQGGWTFWMVSWVGGWVSNPDGIGWVGLDS